MNSCYYAELLEQIKFQKLDSNILFGPVNCLAQKELLQSEDVRFFITIGLDTSRLSQLWDNYLIDNTESVVVNFDPNFKNVSDATTRFFDENLENLRKIATKVMNQEDGDSSQRRLKKLIKNDLVGLCPVYTGDWSAKIHFLLDIAIIFKLASKYGKTLVVSKNGNDNRLTSFLICLQLLQSPQLSTVDVFKFIRVQRPSVHDLTFQFIKLCDSINASSESEPVRVRDKQCRKLEQTEYSSSPSPSPSSSKRACI